jgi:8-oxo-dGTP diphosphatase
VGLAVGGGGLLFVAHQHRPLVESIPGADVVSAVSECENLRITCSEIANQPVDLATLLFVVQDGEILLIRKKRGLGAGKINGPGGRLESGETPTEAAVREVEEELRVTPTGVVESGEVSFQFVDGYSLHVWIFRANGYTTASGLGAPEETDEAIPLWFQLDAIPYDEMWADDRLWLPLLLAREYFRGRFIFDDDTMLDHRVLGVDSFLRRLQDSAKT